MQRISIDNVHQRRRNRSNETVVTFTQANLTQNIGVFGLGAEGEGKSEAKRKNPEEQTLASVTLGTEVIVFHFSCSSNQQSHGAEAPLIMRSNSSKMQRTWAGHWWQGSLGIKRYSGIGVVCHINLCTSSSRQPGPGS